MTEEASTFRAEEAKSKLSRRHRVMASRKADEFSHHFEGPEVLDELLEVTCCPLSLDGVVEAMKAAQSQGQSAQDFVPELFPSPPRFQTPDVAKKFFSNLLGLWDEVLRGATVSLPEPATENQPVREKKPKTVAPGPFPPEGPDEAYLQAVWAYLDALDSREKNRLLDRFENRLDGVLAFLDDEAFSDEAYLSVREVLFRIFVLLEVGRASTLDTVPSVASKRALTKAEKNKLPSSIVVFLDAYLEEKNKTSKVSTQEGKSVRNVVNRVLLQWWQA